MCRWLKDLETRFYNDIRTIRDSYKETDKEFKVWCIENEIDNLEEDNGLDICDDDNSGCDNSILDWSNVWRIQNENKTPELHKGSWGNNTENERISRYSEDNRISIEPTITKYSMYASYPAKKKRKKKKTELKSYS